jgi:hypothetical protein
MTGQITGREEFIIASFIVSALVILGLAAWTWLRLKTARARLAQIEMLEKKGR